MYVVVASESKTLESPLQCVATVVAKPGSRDLKLWGTGRDDLLPEAADSLVKYLYEHAAAGIPIVTFNGTGFTFKKLSSITSESDKLGTIAMLNRDIFLDYVRRMPWG